MIKLAQVNAQHKAVKLCKNTSKIKEVLNNLPKTKSVTPE